MKIAIQGHSTRKKEVIQILESLGGKNTYGLSGNGEDYEYYYHINSCGRVEVSSKYNLHNCKFYTLEEFEKEFPFKIGDKVRDCSDDEIGVITDLTYIDNMLIYNVDFVDSGQAFMPTEQLKPYKEMKEERNIKLTFDKAKEWFAKGGELKEIALQAYSEEELTKVDLPKTWEEFYEQFEFKHVLNNCLSAVSNSFSMRYVHKFEAFVKLQYLRDYWRQGWIYTPKQVGYSIKFINGKLGVHAYGSREFLSFPTREMAEEFLECFKDLIEKAGDLI